VILFELLLLLWGQFSKSVVSTLKLICEAVKGNVCKSLNFLSLFSRDVSSERYASEISSDSDSCGDNVITAILDVEVFEVE